MILSGGTFSPIKAHLSLAAPAFGNTATTLSSLFYQHKALEMAVETYWTQMAYPGTTPILRTNKDVENLVDKWIADPNVKVIIMNAALCDFDATVVGVPDDVKRLDSSKKYLVELTPAPKILSKIRKTRKDIFLVGFKTTAGATPEEQFNKGLKLMKETSCNLVFANDVVTRRNFVITPEEVRYAEGVGDEARDNALKELVDMILLRTNLSFTRSTVIAGDPVPWNSPDVPESLRTVVDHMIARNAYKPGPTGATVGHFACKVGPTTFLTSRRKTNFNQLHDIGLVRIETDGPDTVIAYGSKPSVGGQSQRIIFEEHDGLDCIVHAHVPLREDHPDDIPVVSQRAYECGSHECGQNTSNGLKQFGNLKAVMLDKHGPNVVFHRDTDPQEVIDFIERNFDLTKKTA
jgi:hypothetical protein